MSKATKQQRADITLSEAAREYSLPLRTLQGAAKVGNLPTRLVEVAPGFSFRTVNPSSVEEFIANRPRRGPKPT